MYYVYSIKMQGWWGVGSNYTSDLKQAKQLTRDDALAMCKLHKSTDGFSLIPVAILDVEAI